MVPYVARIGLPVHNKIITRRLFCGSRHAANGVAEQVDGFCWWEQFSFGSYHFLRSGAADVLNTGSQQLHFGVACLNALDIGCVTQVTQMFQTL